MNRKPAIIYLSHGGGPLPLLGDAGHVKMVSCLQGLAAKIPKPSAILVVSAHWEETMPTITSDARPSLVYDYYGFPAAAYDIQYPCVGEPELAGKIHEQLEGAGIRAQLDKGAGFDHGLFVPLKIMFPQADIPCVQLSLVNSLDPATHVDMGRALRDLDHDHLLVVGSGFSFHNMRAFFTPDTPATQAQNEAFEGWLLDTCCSPSIDEVERSNRLVNWEQAPHARNCHPREEHLLPLHVCYGLAGRKCDDAFALEILKKRSSMYLWRSA